MSVTTAPALHAFDSSAGHHLLVVNGSRIYDVPKGLARRAADGDPLSDVELLHGPTRIGPDAPPLPQPSAISLNVAQTCNLRCGYCYADEGRFQGKSRRMNEGAAKALVDQLLAESDPTADVVVGFMGGEPLLNRRVVHATTHYAASRAAQLGRRCRFSITTNGTLLNPSDAELFRSHDFTVAVSIDGDRATNDRLRPGGKSLVGSYDSACAGLDVLHRHGLPKHLSARVTVTPSNLQLLPTLRHLVELGFDEVGFAGALTSPVPALALSAEDFHSYVDGLLECAEATKLAILNGEHLPFGNLETALHQIHRGSHRPYPCSAAAGYLSANADGELYACHRFVDDPAFRMGDLATGYDRKKRLQMLEDNHVDRQVDCASCWARYLCGGGCYHEVSKRGRIGCNSIRRWLDYCLRAYVEVLHSRPVYFERSRLRARASHIPFES